MFSLSTASLISAGVLPPNAPNVSLFIQLGEETIDSASASEIPILLLAIRSLTSDAFSSSLVFLSPYIVETFFTSSSLRFSSMFSLAFSSSDAAFCEARLLNNSVCSFASACFSLSS